MEHWTNRSIHNPKPCSHSRFRKLRYKPPARLTFNMGTETFSARSYSYRPSTQPAYLDLVVSQPWNCSWAAVTPSSAETIWPWQRDAASIEKSGPQAVDQAAYLPVLVAFMDSRRQQHRQAIDVKHGHGDVHSANRCPNGLVEAGSLSGSDVLHPSWRTRAGVQPSRADEIGPWQRDMRRREAHGATSQASTIRRLQASSVFWKWCPTAQILLKGVRLLSTSS